MRADAPSRTPDDLETRLVAAARGPAPLRRALARVAGRMVATQGWERLGFARLADYAAERAGVSARELRDLARVDGALVELPELDAAFASGELGWTQLRLLCRVATRESHAWWLARAARLSSAALAREVRQVDARDPLAAPPDDAPREGVVLRVSARARGRWWSTRSIASRVAGHALSHAAFAEVLAAEVLSGVPPDGDVTSGSEVTGGSSPTPDADKPSPDPAARRRSPQFEASAPAEVAALERGLEDADAFELDRRLRHALGLEARALARVAAQLTDVVTWKLHRDLGYRSVDAYAEDRLGMAASRAKALLRIERAARACPPLREAFGSGRISWVQAQVLLVLLLEPAAAPYRERWIAHARRVSVRRLRDDVERALASGDFALDPSGVQTRAITRPSPVETARLFFTATPEVAQLFRALLATVQRRLGGSPSDALEAMLDHALAAWEPERPDTRIFERDGWRCTAPGCTSHRNLQQHHVVFRSQGGSDDPSNLTTLCAWHHLRGVHGRVIRCTGVAPDALRFELGLRPDAPPLAAYGPGEVRAA